MTVTPLRERLAFGSPDLSVTLLFATVNGWLLFYLVTIVGLPPLWAGTVFVAGRICDALLDPLIGAFADRFGRKRTIAMGLPMAAPAFIALWAVPLWFEDTTPQLIAAAAAFLVFTIGYTCVSIPRLGMLPSFAPTYHDRSVQAAVDMAFVFCALLIASTLFPAAIGAHHDVPLSDSDATTWVGVAIAMAAISVAAYLPFLMKITEKARASVRVSPWKALASLSATGNAIKTLVTFAASVVALVSLQSAMPFWMEIGVGLRAEGQAIVLGTVFAATFASLRMWVVVCRNRGKVDALRYAALLYLVALALAALVPVNSGMSVLLFAVAILAGIATGGLSVCPWAMIPDVAAAHAARLGEPVEGISTAAFTMTNKAAVAASIFGNAGLLAMDVTVTATLALPAISAASVVMLCRSLKGSCQSEWA